MGRSEALSEEGIARQMACFVPPSPVEQQRVPLDRLDGQPLLCAGGPLAPARLLLRIREHRLSTLLRRREIHEHRRDALATMLGRGVGGIVEVIVVGFILLPVLILEQLQGLLVLCGG